MFEEFEATLAPEICVEVMSPSNPLEEMLEKRALYFEQGAVEFWLCDAGNMRFFTAEGEVKNSRRVQRFPQTVQV